MHYWNQIAWTTLWSVFCVVVGVLTIAMAGLPSITPIVFLIGLALSFLFGFLACRAFEKRGRRLAR
jgi:peptidoglycan/LPS O-acetylase OafA/YrhL